jgi:hypothetical protein
MTLEFKLSGGYAYVNTESINKGIASWADWRIKEAEENNSWFLLGGNLADLHSGVHLEGEILLSLTSRIAISLGAGYFYSDVYEKDVEVLVQKISGPISQIFPTTVSAYPVVLSVYYFLPLTSRLKVYARGGGGLAWANFVNREAKKLESAEKYNYFQSDKGTASGPVYMGGLGLAYETDVGVRFFIEGLIRSAKISGFTGENEQEERGTLFYFEEYDTQLDFWQAKNEIRPEAPVGTNFRSVSEAEVDFSGFSVKIGFIIRF